MALASATAAGGSELAGRPYVSESEPVFGFMETGYRPVTWSRSCPRRSLAALTLLFVLIGAMDADERAETGGLTMPARLSGKAPTSSGPGCSATVRDWATNDVAADKRHCELSRIAPHASERWPVTGHGELADFDESQTRVAVIVAAVA